MNFGDRAAVDGVSFDVQPGEVVALLGPNGAGKTTTVETLEGYRLPTSGSVRVLGLDPVRDHRRLVKDLGVVLQRGGVYPVMGPARVLRLFASYYERPRSPDELLGLLALEDVASTPYKRLSGGEQQRLALALALVGRPRVCFLDEPTAGVDPAGRIAVRDVIAACRNEGVAILLTSHELDEVERLAERVVIIDHGKVLAAGPPDEVGGGEEEIRFRVDGPLDTTALGAALNATVTEEAPSSYRIGAPPSPGLVAELTAWLAARNLALADLRIGRERLEDVFLRLVKTEADS
ncbi:MAG TPA: ABC transporter ATP-binding protein [Acidimicrobiales bacterium]|nr:ABC transporter ATP-binding protein [Acidimicrobiales bacterium]